MLGFLAALLLINAVLSFVGRATIVDSIMEAARERGDDVDRSTVDAQLLFSVGRDGVIGLIAVTAVVLLAKRMSAGRWLGIGMAMILLALALFTIVGVGGIPIYSMLLILITLTIIVMLMRQQTAEWLRQPSTA